MILVGTILATLAILVGTQIMVRRARRLGPSEKASVAALIRVNGWLIAVFVLGCGSLWYTVKIWQYNRCRDAAVTRTAFRSTILGFYDTIDAATGTDEYTSVTKYVVLDTGERTGQRATLREALDYSQPAHSPDDCKHP